MNLFIIAMLLFVAQCNSTHTALKESLVQKTDSSTIQNEDTGTMNGNSDYEPVAIDKLIGTADLVVYGNIVRISNTTVTLEIKELVAGTYESKEIEVKQYHPDKFDGGKRPIPYKTGQSYLVFLKAESKSNGAAKQWSLMGFGSEGEMPVFDNQVYFPGRNVEMLAYGEYDLSGNKLRLQRYALLPFIAAIKEYRKCFQWNIAEKTSKTEIYLPALTCDKSTLEKYINTSAIHKYLAESSLSKISR